MGINLKKENTGKKSCFCFRLFLVQAFLFFRGYSNTSKWNDKKPSINDSKKFQAKKKK
jgi:hypothetical protein